MRAESLSNLPRARAISNKVFANPKFNALNMFGRALGIYIVSSLVLGYVPGIIPTLILSSLVELKNGKRGS